VYNSRKKQASRRQTTVTVVLKLVLRVTSLSRRIMPSTRPLAITTTLAAAAAAAAAAVPRERKRKR